MSNFVQAKRPSIINQADVYSQRQVMREALKLTVADDKQGGINDQVWYDSLRETDDGRFSQTQIFAHQTEFLKDKVQKRNDYLKRKILTSTFKSKSGSVAYNTSENNVVSGE